MDKKLSGTLLLLFSTVSPEITLQKKYYVGREKCVSLDCKVEGYPPPTITWTPCNPLQNVCDQRVLNISNVVEDCVYICKAKNSLGFDCASTKLCKSICLLLTLFEHHYYVVEPNNPSDRSFRLFKILQETCQIVSAVVDQMILRFYLT